MTSRTRLIILPRARRDWTAVLQYTQERWGIDQRDTYDTLLDDAMERIRSFPEIGHRVNGKPSSLREFHLQHHTIQYRYEAGMVTILRILNPRRRRI